MRRVSGEGTSTTRWVASRVGETCPATPPPADPGGSGPAPAKIVELPAWFVFQYIEKWYV
jgi:hypothetical protein